MDTRKKYFLHWALIAFVLSFCAIDSIYCFLHHPIEHYVAKGDKGKVDAWAEDKAQGGDSSKLLGGLLFVAIANSNVEMIDYLLKSGADPNVFDYALQTPIYRAVLAKSPEIVALLLDAGANSRHNKFGSDALELAVARRSRPIIEVFLKRGIYPSQTDVDSTNDPSLRDFISSYTANTGLDQNRYLDIQVIEFDIDGYTRGYRSALLLTNTTTRTISIKADRSFVDNEYSSEDIKLIALLDSGEKVHISEDIPSRNLLTEEVKPGGSIRLDYNVNPSMLSTSTVGLQYRIGLSESDVVPIELASDLKYDRFNKAAIQKDMIVKEALLRLGFDDITTDVAQYCKKAFSNVLNQAFASDTLFKNCNSFDDIELLYCSYHNGRIVLNIFSKVNANYKYYYEGCAVFNIANSSDNPFVLSDYNYTDTFFTLSSQEAYKEIKIMQRARDIHDTRFHLSLRILVPEKLIKIEQKANSQRGKLLIQKLNHMWNNRLSID